MARDVFSREIVYGGAFSSDGTRITFGDFRCGMMVQAINYQYSQNINRLYEVGCPDVYLVAGRTQGQAGVQKVLGPKKLSSMFYRQFGDACNRNNNIKFTAVAGCTGDDGGAEQVVKLKHCVLTQVQGAVNANDMLINDSVSMMFLILLMSDNGASLAA